MIVLSSKITRFRYMNTSFTLILFGLFILCSKRWCLVYFTCSFIFRWSLTTIQRDFLMTTKCLLQSQEKKDINIPQLWHQYGKWFEGTIPMRRTKEVISWEQVYSKDMARRRNELSRFLNLQNLTSLTKEVTRWAKFFFFWFLDLICIFVSVSWTVAWAWQN